MKEIYKAIREVKTYENGKLVSIKPGGLVDVSRWPERVVRAHVNQHIIEKTFEAPTPSRSRKKSAGETATA